MSIYTLTLNFTLPLVGYLSAYPLAFLGALASDNILLIRYLLNCSWLRLG
ncbi:hypothetical protein [[Phormidium] sp. ETS-05]|nr:hypothetical protein [[Phormidium] sp. ETS-05]